MFLSAAVLGACTSSSHGGDTFIRVPPYYFPTDGDRRAEYVNQDAESPPWRLIIEKKEV